MNFRHITGATGAFFMPEIMGAGCALFDYDRDGDLDLFLVQGTLLDEKKKIADTGDALPRDWKPGHRLYRNELIPSGKLRLTDVSERAGVNAVGFGMGAAVGDIDNDGDLDLFVSGVGSDLLYRNNGNGTFTDIAREAGVDDPRWSTSAAFLDYDRDGDLDLYVANYVDFTVRGNKRCTAPTGELDYCTPAAYRPQPDRLFRNEGNGRFTDVTRAAGIAAVAGPGLGVTCADFNGDGWLDIYVANDGAANLLWINQKNGAFAENGLLAGVAFAMNGMARAGMGTTAGDFDNDGDQDLLVTNLSREGSTLFRNNGRGDFHDESDGLNITRYSFLSTGFGVGWFDYDNDGWLDLFAANGAVTIIAGLKGSPYPFHQANQLFHNEGEGARFREIKPAEDPTLQLSEVSRGAAFGDVDNDGDVDLLVSNNRGPARLLLNETGARRHWLAVRLQGVKDNRDGIGALISLKRRGQRTLWRQTPSGGSYLSAGDTRVSFGLGSSTSIESLAVRWPNGEEETWDSPGIDRQITLRQYSGKRAPR
ncbi:MAG: CRTAC1 family protein [Blastocatellia bacterium]|nr:CRTAC1 family protein [Blastocatellia bacterium]